MGACSSITFHMTIGLGGSMAVALNALASVPTTGDGGRFCARGPSARSSYFCIRRSLAIEPLSIRRTPFLCSRPRPTPGHGDQAFLLEHRFGASTYMWPISLWVLAGITPIDILDSSPRASVQALVFEQRFFWWSSFCGGHASDPRGIAPETLKEFWTPLRAVFLFQMWLLLIFLFTYVTEPSNL